MVSLLYCILARICRSAGLATVCLRALESSDGGWRDCCSGLRTRSPHASRPPVAGDKGRACACVVAGGERSW
jgi:hypothetical protein